MLKCFVLILIYTIVSFPQLSSSGLTVEHLTLKDGLSQSTISSILQDSDGFMWFGTANGLNRYDGYSFTVYKSNVQDSGSISNNLINYLYEDKDGTLWIATESGLNSFNKRTGKFKRYLTPPNGSRIMPLLEDANNNLWLGGFGGGLMKFNRSDGSCRTFLNDPAIKDNSRDYIWSAAMDDRGNILLGTYHGLVKFDPVKETFTNYTVNTNTAEGTSGLRVYSLLKDGSLFWIGTNSGVLDCFNSVTGKFTHYNLDYPNTVNTGRVYSILHYDRERLLLGTMGDGIKVFNKVSGKVETIISGLTDKRIYSLFVDRTGIIWGGTYTSGINKINPAALKFKVHKRTEQNNLSSYYINSIIKDSRGLIWIGTADGLNKYDASSGRYSAYRINSAAGTSNISSILDAGDDNLWIGGTPGFFKFNKQTGRFTKYDIPAGNSPPVSVLFNLNSKLLICTRGEGIKVFDPAKEEFITSAAFPDSIFSGIRVSSVAADGNGTLWFGTNNGVVKSSAGEVKYFRYEPGSSNTINSNNVISLCYDSENVLWIGTYGGGLNRLDSNGKISWFSEPEGLPDNVVYGILPDRKGNLWLSTNKGICRFNTSDYSVKTYDLSDGLQGLEFNGGAASLAGDGEMFFGGLEGWNSFYPDQIKENSFIPSLLITGLKVFDEELSFDPDKPVELNYDQNFISIDFVGLHYHNPSKNNYAYKLEGIDKEWVFCGNRRFASYTNLEPGEYTFLVKGSNNDGIWNEKPASLTFIIAPPFWNTWWFYFLTAGLLAVVVVSIHRFRVRAKIRELQKIEELRKRIADDFHDELGHKLTKISLYSEIMKRELSGTLNGQEEYLTKISDAANNLYDDTKDFIWSIDPVKDSLFDLAVYLKDFGDEFFGRTGISFIVNEIPEGFKKITLPMNWKRQLTLIFKEAMNNILKHSGCTEVSLHIETEERNLKIMLIDNGKGFREEEVKKSSRGLEIMKNRAAKTGGTLSINASDAAGTEMIFYGELPHMTGKER